MASVQATHFANIERIAKKLNDPELTDALLAWYFDLSKADQTYVLKKPTWSKGPLDP